MARVAKVEEKHQLLRILADPTISSSTPDAGELLVIGPQSRAYLWVGRPGVAITFSGRKALAALRDRLDLILKELP